MKAKFKQKITQNPRPVILLHYNTCNYDYWINNIPKSQFCRLRRNCTNDKDYVKQGALLKQKLIEKDFPQPLIEQAFTTYLTGTNKVLRGTQNSGQQQPRFITQFHSKFKTMEQVLARQWSIPLADSHLKTTLSPKPKFAYMKARNVKSLVAPTKLKSDAESPHTKFVSVSIP